MSNALILAAQVAGVLAIFIALGYLVDYVNMRQPNSPTTEAMQRSLEYARNQAIQDAFSRIWH